MPKLEGEKYGDSQLHQSLDDDDEDVKPGFSDEEDEDDFDADEDVMGLGSSSVAGFAKLSKYAKSSPPIAEAPPIEIQPKIELPLPRAGGNGNAGGSRGVPDENGLLPGDEIIDSDLDDDSEDDDDEDGGGSDGEEEEDTDYVLCVYDKVSVVSRCKVFPI